MERKGFGGACYEKGFLEVHKDSINHAAKKLRLGKETVAAIEVGKKGKDVRTI